MAVCQKLHRKNIYHFKIWEKSYCLFMCVCVRVAACFYAFPQASDVSRSRGASLMARPSNGLVAAIRSQYQNDSVPLGQCLTHMHTHTHI